MATVGGGNFWADFGEKVGLFEDGYAFDALVLDDDPLKKYAGVQRCGAFGAVCVPWQG